MAKRDEYHSTPSAPSSSSRVLLRIDSEFWISLPDFVGLFLKGGKGIPDVAVTQEEGPARRSTASLMVPTVSLSSSIPPCMLHQLWVALVGYV